MSEMRRKDELMYLEVGIREDRLGKGGGVQCLRREDWLT
jgi:hypothetical protein